MAGKIVQITNIAPQTTKDQMHTLFSYVGKIDLIHLYPTIREVAVPGRSLICYVKFIEESSVGVAQHLTNTVFIDRALIVVPFSGAEIPDEMRAFEINRPGPKLAPGVSNQLDGFPPNQVITTHDPRLLDQKLPLYPPLPSTTDAQTIDEIRRTLVVCNLDRSLGSQDLIDFFMKIGEVKYVRFGYRPGDSANYALVELTDQTDIIEALKLNGSVLAGTPIQVYHSVQAIVKPQPKSDEAAQREIQEAMSRVNEAQNLISAAIDPVMALLKKDKKRSRSRSRGRYGRSRRSRSRSRSRRHRRSRSRHRRSRSRSTGRRRRSKSRSRSRKRSRRSRSRDRKRSRSRHRSKSRRRSRSKSKRSRSRSKSSRSRRSDDKSKDKGKDRRDKHDRSRSKDKEKEKKSKERSSSRDREASKENAKKGENGESVKKDSPISLEVKAKSPNPPSDDDKMDEEKIDASD